MLNRASHSSQIITRTLLISCVLLGFFTFGLDYMLYNPTFTPINNNNLYMQPFVNSIEVTEPPITGEKILFIIKGGLPTPCWKMDRHEIQKDTSLKFINITLWAFVPKDIVCIQIVGSFVYELTLQFPSSGNWTIQCNNFNRNVVIYES